MRISSLFLGASLVAIAVPAAAQTTTTRAGTDMPVQMVGTGAPAQAAQPTTTLRDALVLAYNTNPGLQSERANQRA
ncbi:MAG: hypothetical protein GY844_14830, partial [Bradyrhizobium sp.]|nr:hypothetical protein [Bradyrhizobium sp.]